MDNKYLTIGARAMGGRAGDNPMRVLCRLAQEVAYTRKRMCLRNLGKIQMKLGCMEALLEEAIKIVEGDQNEVQS